MPNDVKFCENCGYKIRQDNSAGQNKAGKEELGTVGKIAVGAVVVYVAVSVLIAIVALGAMLWVLGSLS